MSTDEAGFRDPLHEEQRRRIEALSQAHAELQAANQQLKEAQAQLLQSEKMAPIGQLAAGVAHEINNPLGVMLGFVRVLERKADAATAEDLRIIAEEAVRCQEIVEGLIDLARPLKIVGESVALRPLCEEVVNRLGQSLPLPGGGIAIDGDGVANGSTPRLRQVLMNLVKNAAEAAGDQGRVAIRVAPSSDGRFVTVEVRDSGPGIAPEMRDRLFEPFASNKPAGTGLGLAVSQSIAQAHGGSISIADDADGGVIARLSLPRPPELAA